VAFQCDCAQAPGASLRWTFGDGDESTLAAPTHVYAGAGGYQVRLEALDETSGELGFDTLDVAVSSGGKQPPIVRAFADPVGGEAPLTVTFAAQLGDPDGTVVSHEWSLGEGDTSTEDSPRKTFTQPGTFHVELRAVDNDGLQSTSALDIQVTRGGVLPPSLLSMPERSGTVGAPYHYAPKARGGRPLTWSLGKTVNGVTTDAPRGMTVDPASGELSWTPAADQAGAQTVTLAVENPAGADFQDFVITVAGPGSPAPGCGCTIGEAGPSPAGPRLLLALAVLLLVLRRARRALALAVLLLTPAVATAATAPQIVTSGSGFARVGQPYHYNEMDRVVATGDQPITFSAVAPPAGFSIDPTSGAITWTPTAGGDLTLQLKASNAAGAATQSVPVHVADAPRFTSPPTLSATVGTPYLYGSDGSLRATGDLPITFQVTTAPAGFVVDAQTGAVTFTPQSAGSVPIVLAASNPFGTTTQSFTLQVAAGSGVAPVIAHDANLAAAVGLPYAYNPARAITVTAGDAPLSFSKVSGPGELFVDAQSGSLAWIPSAAGAQSIVLRASNLAGSDDYAFSVNVAAGVNAQPTAAVQATPLTGEAPLAVTFDSAGSAAGGDATLLGWSWDFGDGTPPVLQASAQHTYQQAASYTARLTVTNSYGSTATTPVVVTATANGLAPPHAHAVADRVSGMDLLPVAFTCDCTDGSNPIAQVSWDFGDGNQSAIRNPMHSFLPGSYRVHLIVSDAGGLSSEDALTITVARGDRQPPSARAYAAPSSGPAPLAVSLLATAIDLQGSVKSLEWDLGDGTQASALDHVQHTFVAPGVYKVTLTATGDTGLTAVDTVLVTVGSNDAVPPDILTVPSTVAYVGVPYHYSATGLPIARGSRPLTFSADAPPTGLTVHRDTGEVRWTPTADQVGAVTVTLVATNSAASARQTFTVTVRPGSEAPGGSGCGLGSSPAGASTGAAWLALALLALAIRRWMRSR
jgi:MYXO-CTERM domain-containing protein